MTVVIYHSLIVHIMFQFYEVHTLSVESTRNGTGLLNENDTTIECSYTQKNVLKIDYVSFLAFHRSSISFEPIATFIPDLKSVFTPLGQYLKGRVTLTNITTSSTKAVMIFNKLLCVDAAIYTCRVSYIASSGLPGKSTSNNISISVQVPPSNPDSIIVISQPASPRMKSSTSSDDLLSDISKTTTIYSTQQTTKTQGIAEGDNITVVCTGDVGNPPATFVFENYHDGHILSMNYTASATSTWEISDNCSYYRTSNVTFQVKAEDNSAVIRCVVNSSMAKSGILYVETTPMEVYFQVGMPTIQLYPNKTDYVFGEDSSINFICKTDGNPKPNYQWYKESNDEPISDSENFTITDMNKTDSGMYICNVSNTFNDKTYKNAANIQINITNKADIATTQSSSTGSSSGADDKEEKSKGNLGLVIGIVVGIVTVIVFPIVIIAWKRRKNKSPTFKNESKSFDDSKPKPVTEPRTGDYDYIALEDDASKTQSVNNGVEVEDISKHNEEYLKKQEEEEQKKNESNSSPQPAVYAQVNEATKSRNKQKTETTGSADKQEEDTYAETQEGIYDKAGDRRHKENENVEHFDASNNSSKQNSSGDTKLSIQTSQVGSYANQAFEKDENRKVATVSPTIRSSSGSQNDKQTNLSRDSQSKKGYENIIGTDQTVTSEEDSSHRTAL